jgi:hypothetical protein
MVIFLRAHLKRHQLVIWRPLVRLAPRNEIWPRPPDSVLDKVGDEEREDEADEPAQNRDVCLMGAWLED